MIIPKELNIRNVYNATIQQSSIKQNAAIDDRGYYK